MLTAELHDGRTLEFPDGTDPAVIQATVKRMLGPQKAPEMSLDPTEGMNWFEKAAAGAGKSVVDTGRGIGQMLGVVPQEEIDEANQRDKALMATGGGMVGNVAGQVAQMALPAGALLKSAQGLRAVNPLLRAASSGGAFAATQPVQSGNTRLGNAAIGGALGAAGQGIAQGMGALAGRAADKISPAVRSLYEKAQGLGIPVNAAQLSDSKFLKTLQSTLEHLPFTGAQQARNTQQQAFNRSVSKTFGEDAPAVTRDVYAGAKQRIGGEFERLSTRNALNANDPTMLSSLATITDEARRFANDDTSRAVSNAADELLSKADASGMVPGKAYQALDSKLGKIMAAGGEKAMFLGRLRDAVRSAMDDSIAPADKEAWKTARGQYRNLKTVRDLVAKEGADGNISPSLLMGRVNSSQAGKEANAMGRGGEMADLARIGRQFVRDPVPNSGTVQRATALGLLGGASGVNYSKDEGLGFDPTTALLAAGGAATLGRGANKAINSKALAKYLQSRGLTGLLGDAAQVAPYGLPAGGLLYLSQ